MLASTALREKPRRAFAMTADSAGRAGRTATRRYSDRVNPERFDDSVLRWVALRTSARWEKKLAELLVAVDVPVYLPQLTRVTDSAGRTKSSRLPLFPGYVFAGAVEFLGNPRVLPAARSMAAQVLKPSDETRLREELRAVADLLQDRELVQRRVAGHVGDRVEVIGGPLLGYRGPIIRVKPNRFQVVLEVSFLGARLEVEVDEGLVQKV